MSEISKTCTPSDYYLCWSYLNLRHRTHLDGKPDYSICENVHVHTAALVSAWKPQVDLQGWFSHLTFPFHSCHVEGGWSHIFHCSTCSYEVMSGPEYLPLLPSLLSSPLLPPLHISLTAEIIQKECLALVEQMIGRARERETEEEKKSNREIVFLWCFEGLSVLLFPGNHKAVLSTGSVLPRAVLCCTS